MDIPKLWKAATLGIAIIVDLAQVPEEVRRCIELEQDCRGSLKELIRLRCERDAIITPSQLPWITKTIENASETLNELRTIFKRCKPQARNSMSLKGRVLWRMRDSTEFKAIRPVLESRYKRVLAAITTMGSIAGNAPVGGTRLECKGLVDSPHDASPSRSRLSLDQRVQLPQSLVCHSSTKEMSRLESLLSPASSPPHPPAVIIANITTTTATIKATSTTTTATTAAAPRPANRNSLEQRAQSKCIAIIQTNEVAGIASLCENAGLFAPSLPNRRRLQRPFPAVPVPVSLEKNSWVSLRHPSFWP
ncbi:hypothetical protein RB595_009973 [Gaeumannomyces hyphopodioides]